jgi:hypothetical protein
VRIRPRVFAAGLTIAATATQAQNAADYPNHSVRGPPRLRHAVSTGAGAQSEISRLRGSSRHICPLPRTHPAELSRLSTRKPARRWPPIFEHRQCCRSGAPQRRLLPSRPIELSRRLAPSLRLQYGQQTPSI